MKNERKFWQCYSCGSARLTYSVCSDCGTSQGGRYTKEIERLEKREKRLEEALQEACANMERARNILQDGFRRTGWTEDDIRRAANWGMLDTSRLRGALADEAAGGGDKPKTICHAEGDRCHGCAHYWGKASVCEFADEAPPQQRDALEAFHRIITWSNEDYHHDGMHSRQADTKTVRRTLTNPAVPTVPEAVRRLPDELRQIAARFKETNYERGLYFAIYALDRALAQSGEGRVPDSVRLVERITKLQHRIHDAIAVLEGEVNIAAALEPGPEKNDE